MNKIKIVAALLKKVLRMYSKIYFRSRSDVTCVNAMGNLKRLDVFFFYTCTRFVYEKRAASFAGLFRWDFYFRFIFNEFSKKIRKIHKTPEIPTVRTTRGSPITSFCDTSDTLFASSYSFLIYLFIYSI